MRQSGSRKWQWQNGFWATRVAVVLGVLALGIGIADPPLLQDKVLGALSVAAIILSMSAIVMTLWQIERRSRRLGQPLFWLSLFLNLVLIVAVGFVYYRGINRSSLPRYDDSGAAEAPPPAPLNP